MPNLTDRQQEILGFITQRIAQNLPPTLAEIAQAFGFKQTRAAHKHLLALEAKGQLELLPGKARGIRLVHAALEAVSEAASGLPLLGRVAAGRPLLASAHIERRVQIDPSLFSPRADFLLRVQGESMSGVGIFSGDLLAIHRTPLAAHGQVVVARIDDEVTVKRLHRSAERVALLAENPAFAAIEVTAADSFAIEGQVVGIIRSLTLSSL